MNILEINPVFSNFSLNFLYFTPKNYFPQEYFLGLFHSEPGHIPDFENEDNISIGIS